MSLKREVQDGRQQQQEREQRHDPVVGNDRCEIGALVVDELVDHREGQPGAAMPSLVAVEPFDERHAVRVLRYTAASTFGCRHRRRDPRAAASERAPRQNVLCSTSGYTGPAPASRNSALATVRVKPLRVTSSSNRTGPPGTASP